MSVAVQFFSDYIFSIIWVVLCPFVRWFVFVFLADDILPLKGQLFPATVTSEPNWLSEPGLNLLAIQSAQSAK